MGRSVSDAGDADRAPEPELELEPVPAQYAAFIDEELSASEKAKLENLGRALAKANSPADVSSIAAEFGPIFESASTAAEGAAQAMKGEAMKIARAASKRGGSAASKL